MTSPNKGPHYSSSNWYPLYKWEDEDLWVVRETGPDIADDIALFQLVRGGTEANNPRLGTEVSTLNIVLDNIKKIGWKKPGTALHGPNKLYSEYWLAFLHDLVLPREIRVDRIAFWSIPFVVPHFIDDLIMERMKTLVPGPLLTLQELWKEFVRDWKEFDKVRNMALKAEKIILKTEEDLGKRQLALAEMRHQIMTLPFASPVRHQVYFPQRATWEAPIQVRMNDSLSVSIMYVIDGDYWSVNRLNRKFAPRITGDTMAEAWESFLEWLADSPEEEGAGVVLDSQYDDWVDSLEQGEELVDITVYEALNAGNPVIWPEPQFVEWMDSKEGL